MVTGYFHVDPTTASGQRYYNLLHTLMKSVCEACGHGAYYHTRTGFCAVCLEVSKDPTFGKDFKSACLV